MTRLDAIASRTASDYPADWLRMSEAQRDYWRRMVRRVESAVAEVDGTGEQRERAA